MADASRSFDIRAAALDGAMELRLSEFLHGLEDWIRRLRPALQLTEQPDAGPRQERTSSAQAGHPPSSSNGASGI